MSDSAAQQLERAQGGDGRWSIARVARLGFFGVPDGALSHIWFVVLDDVIGPVVGDNGQLQTFLKVVADGKKKKLRPDSASPQRSPLSRPTLSDSLYSAMVRGGGCGGGGSMPLASRRSDGRDRFSPVFNFLPLPYAAPRCAWFLGAFVVLEGRDVRTIPRVIRNEWFELYRGNLGFFLPITGARRFEPPHLHLTHARPCPLPFNPH